MYVGKPIDVKMACHCLLLQEFRFKKKGSSGFNEFVIISRPVLEKCRMKNSDQVLYTLHLCVVRIEYFSCFTIPTANS